VDLANRYSNLDRLLHRISFATLSVQIELADLENLIYRRALATIPCREPVFITALPRAGTTLLLQLISSLDRFASHTYRDMPFVLLPLMWQSISGRFRQTSTPTERAHGDGMMVSVDSVEAFEEMLWKAKCPDQYLPDRIAPWPAAATDEIAAALTSHMKKIIYLRQRTPDVVPRYISKNNGNIARVGCLLKCLPDAVIVVPIREPIQHAASLAHQHRHFLEIHARDRFACEYMRGIGHFDFGANLRPIDFGGWLASAHHTDQRTVGFWLEYWVAAYSHVLSHGGAVRVLPFDELCSRPDDALRSLAEVLNLDADNAELLLAQQLEIRDASSREVDLTGVRPSILKQAQDLYQSILSRSDFASLRTRIGA